MNEQINQLLGKIKQINILKIQPGDTLLIGVQEDESIDVMNHIKAAFSEVFPDNTVFVVAGQVNYQVIEKANGGTNDQTEQH